MLRDACKWLWAKMKLAGYMLFVMPKVLYCKLIGFGCK